MYGKGTGVARDYVKSHMWLSLAGLNGEQHAIKFRTAVEKVMTPAQIAEAQRLAREWKSK